MKINRYIVGGLLAATLPAAQAGLLGAGVLSGANSGQGGVAGIDLLNADNALGLQLLDQPLIGQGGQALPLAAPGLPLLLPRGALPAVSLAPLAGLSLGHTGGQSNGDLLDAALFSGPASGNGGAVGLAVANGRNSGNGGLVGASVLSGGNSGNGGLVGAAVLSGDNSGNSGLVAASLLSGNNSGNVGDGLITEVPGLGLGLPATGVPGLGLGLLGRGQGLPALPALPELLALPGADAGLPGLGGSLPNGLSPTGLLSVRIINQPAGQRGLVDAGLLNTDFLLSLRAGGVTLLDLPPGAPALHAALSNLRDQLRATGAGVTPILLGLADGAGNPAAGNPLNELGLGELAELSLAGTGDSAIRTLSVRLLDGSDTGNGDLIGLSALGEGGNANAGLAGVSILGGLTSGNGGTAGVSALGAGNSGNGGVLGSSVLGGNNNGNGGLIGLAALSGNGAGNGGLAGISVLSGNGSGNGGLIGLAILSGDGSGNTAADGIAGVQLLSGSDSGNGGLTTVSLVGGENSGNPGTGPGLSPDNLLGIIALIPDSMTGLPIGDLPDPLLGTGVLNDGVDRDTGSLLDLGVVENDNLLTLDVAGQDVLDLDLLGPELSDLAGAVSGGLTDAGVMLVPVALPVPDNSLPILGLNQPDAGDSPLAIVGIDLLGGSDGADGGLVGGSVLGGSGSGSDTGGVDGISLPGVDLQDPLIGAGLLNDGVDREAGSLVDLGVVENDKLLTVDVANQNIADIDLLGPELTDLAGGISDGLTDAGATLIPGTLPIPTDGLPLLGLNQPDSGDSPLAIVGVDLLGGSEGADGSLVGGSILASNGGESASGNAAGNGSTDGSGLTGGNGDSGFGSGGDMGPISDLAPVTTLPGDDGNDNGTGVDTETGSGTETVAGTDENPLELPEGGTSNGDLPVIGGPDGGLPGTDDIIALNPLPGLDDLGVGGGQSGNNDGGTSGLPGNNPDATGTDSLNGGNGALDSGDGNGSHGDATLNCVADVAEEEVDRADDERQCNREEPDTLALR